MADNPNDQAENGGPDDTLPDGWRELDSDERDSTIATFVTGWTDGSSSVLLWEGEEHEGEVVIETHLVDEVPEDAEYVIEVLDGGLLKREVFAETEPEAVERGRELVADYGWEGSGC